MAERVLMTALSPTMEEGQIVSWNKREGDSVSSGDVLCEVETDKATMDYEATQEGTILKIVIDQGNSAKVGDTIAIIGESGEDISGLEKEIEKSAAAGSKEEAPPVAAEAPSVEAQAPAASQGAAGPPAPRATEPAAPPAAPQGASGRTGALKASPLARKMAADRGIDLSTVSGSGPDGRVVKRDVEDYKGPAAGATAAAGGAGAQAGAQAFGAPEAGAAPADRTIPVGGRRAVIARRLAESKFSAPHFYLSVSVDMTNIIEARQVLNKALPQKASFNSFLIKFAAEAIRRHPNVNASWQGDKIVEYGSVDIGLAVDAGNGLITPIVRNCANRGVVAIDADLTTLIDKAQNNALKPEEYTGATFTISNLGSFGIEEFTAIINPPGSAILAVGQTIRKPVVDANDQVVVKPMMKMTLSCDHRVIDGAAGARFLNDLAMMLEQPARLVF
ncbi:MAG: pyruvate dehydrogenase complex dihydrolipoamide acetyltransferase [Spirochaetaceae bacterium]